jgi:hypothetical protein
MFDDYARLVNSNLYAIYDGNIFVLMQMAFPFLIGLEKFDIYDDELKASTFARNLWDITLANWKGAAKGPVKPFDNYSVFLHWKSTLRIIVKDAYIRKTRDDEKTIETNEANDSVNEIMSTWQSHFLK